MIKEKGTVVVFCEKVLFLRKYVHYLKFKRKEHFIGLFTTLIPLNMFISQKYAFKRTFKGNISTN